MTIDVRGIPSGGALHAHAIKRLTGIVKRLATAPVEAQAKFFDDNGPRGGRAMRCALTVRLPYRSHVRVEHTAETPRLAFDGTVAALERELEAYRERFRQSQ